MGLAKRDFSEGDLPLSRKPREQFCNRSRSTDRLVLCMLPHGVKEVYGAAVRLWFKLWTMMAGFHHDVASNACERRAPTEKLLDNSVRLSCDNRTVGRCLDVEVSLVTHCEAERAARRRQI